MAISVSDLGTVNDTGTDDSAFAFGSFGAEASDRYLIALITTRDTAAVYSVSTVTIGGVSASIAVQSVNNSSASKSAIAIALVPTGASGSVDVVWTEAIALDQTCTLLRVTGLASATPYDTSTNEGSTSGTSSNATGVDYPAGGLVVAVSAWGTAGAGTWTNIATEDADEAATDGNHQHFAGHEVFASSGTGVTVSSNFSSSSNRSIAVACFSPQTGYTLAQDGGSFTLTGGATGLTAQRKLVQSGGTFSLTGGDTTFRKGFTMVASGGSYSLTGGDATFPLTRKLAMSGGSFSFTGGDTGLLAGRKIVATGGLFSLTGGDAALTAQRILAAAGGSFALTGGDADLRKGFTLSMLGGTFSLSGGDVDFVYVPSAGSPVVSGGHFGLPPRKRKWRKVDLETLDQTIRETMHPDLIVLKDGTKVPVYPIDMDDEEILLLL